MSIIIIVVVVVVVIAAVVSESRSRLRLGCAFRYLPLGWPFAVPLGLQS